MFREHAGFRVLRVFMEDASREIHLRDVAKVSGVSPASAKRYLDLLHEENLLLRRKHANLLLYRGNLENPALRQMRVAHWTQRLVSSGLVDYLVSRLSPSSITLYGSVARGDDSAESDIDILAIAKRRKVALAKFERELGREVCLLVYDWRALERRAGKETLFYENLIVDGIPLHGKLPLLREAPGAKTLKFPAPGLP